MTSVILRDGHVVEEEEPPDQPWTPPTLPITNHNIQKGAARGAIGCIKKHYVVRAHAKEGGSLQPGRLRGQMFWLLLFAVIPSIVISMLRTFCKASISSATHRVPETSTRRLSHSEENSQEDSILSQIVEECAAMEEDLGVLFRQGDSPAQALDAAEQVAKIAFTLYQDAQDFERSMQQTQSASHPSFLPIPPSPPTVAVHSQHENLAGAFQLLEHEYGAQGSQHLTSGPSTPKRQTGSLPPQPLPSSSQPFGGAYQHLFVGPSPFYAYQSPYGVLPQGAVELPHPGIAVPQSVAGPHSLSASSELVGLLTKTTASLLGDQGALVRPHPGIAASHTLAGAQPPLAAPQTGGLSTTTAPLLPQGVAQRDANEQSDLQPEGDYPGLDPDSWLDGVPMIGSSPEGQMQSQAFSAEGPSSNQAESYLGTACQALTDDENSGDSGQSSSPASAGGGGEASATAAAAARTEAASNAFATAGTLATPAVSNHADWISQHPFVKLPVLQDDVVPPPFRLSTANFMSTNDSSVPDILLSIRCLFMKESLNEDEAGLLVGSVQELAVAAAARARTAKRMSRPLYGVLTVGRQFLILDAIVSAFRVLRVSPSSYTWWKAFTECFDTDYRYPEPAHRTHISQRVNTSLANRLLDAMCIYKTGKLPDREEIIDLKQLLFFSPHAPPLFKRVKWEPWRSDFIRFEREHPAISEWLLRRRQLLN